MLVCEAHRSVGRGTAVSALAFSPDGTMLASGSRDGAAIVRDESGRAQPLLEPSSGAAIHTIAFLPDQTVAVAGEQGWDLYRRAGGGWQRCGPAFAVPTSALAVVDADTLAIGIGERHKPTAGKFELYDRVRDRHLEPCIVEPNGVRAVAACAAMKLVAWATGHKELKVWDVRRQTPVRFATTHSSPAIALAPDGSVLIAAVDWGARLFDLATRRERAALKEHKGHVSAVAFSPEGSTVATGSWDSTVRLWDAASGRQRDTWCWPVGKVFSLAYAPDGLRLAAGGDSGAVVVWDVD